MILVCLESIVYCILFNILKVELELVLFSILLMMRLVVGVIFIYFLFDLWLLFVIVEVVCVLCLFKLFILLFE